jgi:hypothetical protein
MFDRGATTGTIRLARRSKRVTQSNKVERQHNRVQDENWPKVSRQSVGDKGDIAGNRQCTQRNHPLRTECGQYQAGREITYSVGYGHADRL